MLEFESRRYEHSFRSLKLFGRVQPAHAMVINDLQPFINVPYCLEDRDIHQT